MQLQQGCVLPSPSNALLLFWLDAGARHNKLENKAKGFPPEVNKSCECHLAVILDLQSHTIIYDTSHPFKKDDI